MIKAIIVEDEEYNARNLQRLLNKYCHEVEVVAMAASADEASNLIRKVEPQLVFLDVQMPGKDGFQLLQELGRYDFEVIFITAYSEYGIRALKFSAIDYLLKPIHLEELQSAVAKAVRRAGEKRENANLKNLLSYFQNKGAARIAISSVKEIRLVAVEEILRCESENSYTHFFLADGEKILSTTPINAYDELLKDYGFLRCHQSHLINKKFVRSLLKGEGYALHMTDGAEVPVSRLKRDAIRRALLEN